MKSSASLLVVIVAIGLAGCQRVESAIDAAIPDLPVDCRLEFSEARCEAMADVVAASAGRTRAEVVGLVILPTPTPPDGMVQSGSPVFVRADFADGTFHETAMCHGVPSGQECIDEPAVEVHSVTSGYFDVPCGGDDPATCATPLPTLEPASITSAAPILIPSVDLVIERVGRHDVPVGEGSLPNGILTEATLRLDFPWPDGVDLSNAGVLLDVRSLEPDGRRFDNHYRHGWRPGVERVQAVVVFEVMSFEPGAELRVRDVVVR